MLFMFLESLFSFTLIFGLIISTAKLFQTADRDSDQSQKSIAMRLPTLRTERKYVEDIIPELDPLHDWRVYSRKELRRDEL